MHFLQENKDRTESSLVENRSWMKRGLVGYKLLYRNAFLQENKDRTESSLVENRSWMKRGLTCLGS